LNSICNNVQVFQEKIKFFLILSQKVKLSKQLFQLYLPWNSRTKL